LQMPNFFIENRPLIESQDQKKVYSSRSTLKKKPESIQDAKIMSLLMKS